LDVEKSTSKIINTFTYKIINISFS